MYERIFEKPYEDGYEDLPLETTPVTARTLNDKDDALEHIEDYLETVIEANPELSGDEESLNAIKIEGVPYKIEGGGGGNANIWVGHEEDYDPDDPTIPLNALVCFDDDTEEITYAEGVAF